MVILIRLMASINIHIKELSMYGILKYDSIDHKEIMKCNMCVHRSEDGQANPMCVEKCPMGAITLEEVQA